MSIKNKLFFLLSLIMIIITLSLYLFSEIHFEKYYFNVKKDKLLEVSEYVKTSGYDIDIGKLEQETGVRVDLFPFDFIEPELLQDSGTKKEEILGLLKNPGTYFYKKSIDRFFRVETLVLFTAYDNKRLLVVGVPVNFIKEQMDIVTAYHLKIIFIAFILGIILVKVFSGRITKPLIEIQNLAHRVARFDFSKRFTKKSKDEIGDLGESINMMSESLESNILEINSAKEKLLEANKILLKDIEKEKAIDQMRKEFISNVSHELKTPIAVISNYTEGLRDGIAPDEKTRNFYLEIIQDEVLEMDKLVKSLLFLSKLERGYEDFAMEELDLKEIIEKEISINKLLMDKKSITLKSELENGQILGDHDKISMVIRNLISNAVKYVSDNGSIHIKLQKIDKNMRFEIFNNCDIEEDELEKLWVPFFRVDKSRTRDSGTGLGLTIVRKILSSHGYRYGVEKVEKGLLFWFEGGEVEI
ncbi:sensor histidine kinase [Ilyobacter polytropus]|uniref:histidine kinase n=1 Tax=Ilyobacter polytropus (strain ATCC 51220 / DSM 2926 / LMG 16218 / CuHBu1) TaxID=572544 RepID=E3H6W8_ILYPC|nr:HAMP domain-containing sensor histidine kinase [Ilyobacter polytropus]ADO82487.1 integral membrane sensor signal transduction histidine kinase [Ilyobacter polytropus DSM 2926]